MAHFGGLRRAGGRYNHPSQRSTPMAESRGPSTPDAPRGQRLDSWKEIAEHMRRGVTTVQRWEREEGLPVHRHAHGTGGTVFAYTTEIDQWLTGRSDLPAGGRQLPDTSDSLAVPGDVEPLEPIGGAIAPDSPYYIRRAEDEEFERAVARRAGLILVKGARQMGKSSLLARGLEYARRAGARVVLTDLQTLGTGDLTSAEALFKAIGRDVGQQLGLRSSITTDWMDEDSRVSILSLEQGTVKRLTSPPASSSKVVGDFWPVFSPDGRMLAFVRSDRYLKEDLYVIGLDGSAPRLVATGQSRIMGLTWTPDGREIVYSSTRSGGFRVSLWRIRLAGGPPLPVHEADANALDPSVSRRGGRLVYTHAYFDTNIWRFPLSGGTAASGTRLIHSTMSEYSAAYSPDGRRIAFESARSGEQEIWVCNAEGSEVTQLTFRHVSPTGSPRWSYDGNVIAFDSRHGEHEQIWVIPSRGGEPRRLTDDPFQNQSPTWSRDGKWIYYSSERAGGTQIWKVPAEGGVPVQITTQGGGPAMESVDGQFLLYTRENAAGIWRVPVSGGREVQVYDFPDRPAAGRWGITTRGVYFARRQDDRWLFFLLDFASEAIRPVAAVASGRLWGQIDVAPDDEWLLATVTDEGTADIRLIEGFR
jgi:Tol biopolymer transport system component